MGRSPARIFSEAHMCLFLFDNMTSAGLCLKIKILGEKDHKIEYADI